jgi:hypothetical protein
MTGVETSSLIRSFNKEQLIHMLDFLSGYDAMGTAMALNQQLHGDVAPGCRMCGASTSNAVRGYRLPGQTGDDIGADELVHVVTREDDGLTVDEVYLQCADAEACAKRRADQAAGMLP